jgi:hypothetical protein
MNNTFEFNRFIKLIGYRIAIHRRIWMMQVGAFAGVAFILSGILFSFPDLNSSKEGFQGIYQILYMFLLVATGAYLTSRSFHEYRSTSTGFAYMMMPASTFEKFLVPAIFGGIVYYLVYTTIFVGLAIVTNWFWSLIYGYTFYAFNPFMNESYPLTSLFFIIYMILQPLFLTGSIALRKNHFILTGIWIFVTALIFLFYGLILTRCITGEYGELGIELQPEMMKGWTPYAVGLVAHIFLQVVSYYKLKEKEV